MKRYITVALLCIFSSQIFAKNLDSSCVASGDNPLWSFVNEYKSASLDHSIKANFPLPETKLVNAAIFGDNEILLKSKRALELDPKDAAQAIYAAALMGRIDTSSILIDLGVSPNATVENNLTPLYAAVQYGCTDEIRYLVKRGANINLRANVGFTLLESAVSSNYFDTASTLMELGYMPDAVEMKRVRDILSHSGNIKEYERIFHRSD